MDPGPFFYFQSTIKLFTALCLLSANYYFLPFDTFNPLFSAKPVRLTTSSQVGDRVLWLCCAGFEVASNTFESFPSSYWFDNLGFLLWENLLLCSSHLPLGDFQRSAPCEHHQGIFWHRCRGVKDIFTRGVPHNQSLYFVVFVFLSFFLLCLLVLLSKTQKN